MAHYNVEIIYDSRKADNARTGAKQTFVVGLCLDPTIEPIFSGGEFLGGNDDVVALEYAYSIFPEIRYLPDYSGATITLILQSIGVVQTGRKEWKATAVYVFNVNSGTGGERPPGGAETLPYIKIGFTIGGGTKQIVKDLETVEGPTLRIGAVLPDVPNLFGAIGWNQDGGLDGTQVPDSTFRLQITGYYFPEFVTMSFTQTIQSLVAGAANTGSYNSGTYLQRASGEVSLLSASGGGTIVDIIPITFEFSLANNLNSQTDVGFTPLTMLGHDVVDYTFIKDFDDAAKLEILSPTFRTVHRVRTAENYSILGLPV